MFRRNKNWRFKRQHGCDLIDHEFPLLEFPTFNKKKIRPGDAFENIASM
jgi:hypothetical protein